MESICAPCAAPGKITYKAPHEHQATSSLSEVKLEAALVLLLLLGGRLALALTEETARVDGGKNPLG